MNKFAVAVAGLPTSGKTTLGNAIAKAMGIHFVDIDAGPVACGPPQEPNPYQSDQSKVRERARMTVAYRTLHAAVGANLTEGFSLVLSATYSRHSNQDFLVEAVRRGGGELKMILCQYRDTEEEVSRRVEERLMRGAVGGCRSVSHYFDDKSRYEGINIPHIVVTTDGGVDSALSQALAYIQEP